MKYVKNTPYNMIARIVTFKKFFIFTFCTSFILVVIIGIGLFFATKSEDLLQSFIVLFVACLIASLFFGIVGSYLAASKNITYNVEDENLAVNLISKTLNKAGYSDKEEKSGELIFTPQPHIEKFYGKVYIKIHDKTVEVRAPRILVIKYLNRVKVQ